MKSNQKDSEKKLLRVELKYCEHCGGLWVRESGGGVYCEKCQAKVADLPVAKKRGGRLVLPVARRTVVEDYDVETLPQKESEFEAAGGAA